MFVDLTGLVRRKARAPLPAALSAISFPSMTEWPGHHIRIIGFPISFCISLIWRMILSKIGCWGWRFCSPLRTLSVSLAIIIIELLIQVAQRKKLSIAVASAVNMEA